eukprot:CAMPEP_0174911306 /NCGR_PEP_ID=MMETSP0167-20121228/76156_1 /TAXON_ID=38298 /ORGANISM="Rhodella maculata, Strain CCMP736" /LENGTH=91 /DNA_ID=CAMNT_0016155771 /DNA_START=48 /DNA_END=323 /DNA_ORIENTATION=+
MTTVTNLLALTFPLTLLSLTSAAPSPAATAPATFLAASGTDSAPTFQNLERMMREELAPSLRLAPMRDVVVRGEAPLVAPSLPMDLAVQVS